MNLKSKEKLFCLIRKSWVAALPEECVRQRVIRHMIDERGFPASLISVEKAVRQLPHLSVTDRRLVPDRRADIICFAKEKGKEGLSSGYLYPLLIVECKAIKLNSRVINQVVGYNYYIGASFIAIANQEEIRVGWFDKGMDEYIFVDYLPSYEELR